MRKALFLATLALLGAAFLTPELHAQRAGRRGSGQQKQQLRKRDGSCTKPAQGRGLRQGKQDGSGPRGGTAACPKTPVNPPKK